MREQSDICSSVKSMCMYYQCHFSHHANSWQFVVTCIFVVNFEHFADFFLQHYVSSSLYLFIFGCIGSSLLRVGFLQLQRAGATLHCGAQASHCSGFSLQRTGSRHTGFSSCNMQCQQLWHTGSVVVAQGLSSCGSQTLEHRFSSCGAQAQLLHGMWDLPGPGIESMSPALAGGFLTNAPPGNSLKFSFYSEEN